MIQVHTQDIQDNYNWFNYDFQGLIRPEYGSPLLFDGTEYAEYLYDDVEEFLDDNEYY